jgi:hypothetical protein
VALTDLTARSGRATVAHFAVPALKVVFSDSLKTLDCGGSAGRGGLPVTGAAAGSIAAARFC